MSPEFVCHPSVFALSDTYQIIVPVKSEMLFWVTVGNMKYCDHSNGILRSSTLVHRVEVPMKELDQAKRYTVCYRKIIDRKPYFPESEPVVELSYDFKPLEAGKPIKLFHISDSHGKVEEAIAAGNASFKEGPDLLILNGDIANHSGSFENISMIYKIASGITEGRVPVIFSRGNHDMRGAMAEQLAEYTPTSNGLSYFTFRLGELWGMVLDCAEDKSDTNAEYGGTVCCHEYRLAETRFIKEVIAKSEYNSADVKHKIVVCHIPFTSKNTDNNGEFDIENDIYDEWVRLIGDSIKPDLLIAGHFHICRTVLPKNDTDCRGQSFPVIIGAKPATLSGKRGFTGTAINFSTEKISARFTDNTGASQTAAEFKKQGDALL